MAVGDEHVDALIEALGDEFVVDDVALRRAIGRRSRVNIFHEASATKIDLFVAGGTPLDAIQLERRRRVQVTAKPPRSLWVYTPEDILLQKLRWYKLGNEVSDRQWRDVLGIVLVQGEHLDRQYLADAAERLSVADLLARALEQTEERKSRLAPSGRIRKSWRPAGNIGKRWKNRFEDSPYQPFRQFSQRFREKHRERDSLRHRGQTALSLDGRCPA